MIQTRGLSAFVAAIALAAAVLPVQRLSAQQDDALPKRVIIPTAIPTLIMPPVPSVAPGYRAPQVQPSAAQIVGVTQQRFVGISLQDAIAMALLKNPNLAVSASDFRVARYNIVEAKGQFDVQLHLQPSSNFSRESAARTFSKRDRGRSGNTRRGRRLRKDPATSSSTSRRSSTAWAGRPSRAARIRPEFSRAAPTTTRSSTRTTPTISRRSTSR